MPVPVADVSAAFALARGDRYRFHGCAADRLHVGAGALRLVGPPVWLAENLVSPGRDCAAGECLMLGRDGWYEVEALTDSRLRLEVAAAPTAGWRLSLWRRGMRLAGRFF